MRTRPSGTVSVVIADDQAAVRDSLVAILSTIDDVLLVGVAANGTEAVGLAERHDADVVLMDVAMPETDGIEATRRLAVSRPETSVVLFSTYTDTESISAAFGAGAAGLLTKDASAADIDRALHTAASGPRSGDLGAGGPAPGDDSGP